MGNSDDLTSVKIRLPEEVIRILDELVVRGLYSNRSEAIRDFVRHYVQEARHG